MRIRTYSELIQRKTFKERYDYLNLIGEVGSETFGRDRILNQWFYSTQEWKKVREKVIIRDNGCDLGIEGYEIHDRVYVHHLNPITVLDLEEENWEVLLNPENLICTSHSTHNAIHFGDETSLPKVPIERRPGDTCPWRKHGKLVGF